MGEHHGAESNGCGTARAVRTFYRPAELVKYVDEQKGEDFLFALEVVVERGLRHPGGGGDVLHLGRIEAELGEELRSSEDLLAHSLREGSQRIAPINDRPGLRV